MSTDNSKLIETGIVTAVFTALARPVDNYKKTAQEYRVRYEKWHTEADSAKLASELEAINRDLVLNKHRINDPSKLSHEDNFIGNAACKDQPTVFDKDGKVLDPKDIPMIKSGTMKLKLAPFKGKDGKGGGVNLVAVQLIDIEEHEGSTTKYDPADLAF